MFCNNSLYFIVGDIHENSRLFRHFVMHFKRCFGYDLSKEVSAKLNLITSLKIFCRGKYQWSDFVDRTENISRSVGGRCDPSTHIWLKPHSVYALMKL